MNLLRDTKFRRVSLVATSAFPSLRLKSVCMGYVGVVCA